MKNSSLFIFLFIILYSCNKDDKFGYPLVFTGDVINITDSSATFVAKINSSGLMPIKESGFIWDLYPNYRNGFKIINTKAQEGVYELKTNLKLLPGRTYYVRPYIQTETSLSYGKEITFRSNDRLIALGNWKRVYDDYLGYGWCEFINSGFTYNNITYFAFEDGTLYGYNHVTNKFGFVCSNPILTDADFSLVHNDKIFIFSINTIYDFDIQTKVFTKKVTINETLNGASGFIVGDNIYFGLGALYNSFVYTKKFWSYNISTGKIKELSSFPGDYRCNAFSFVLNNKGYVGGGFNLIQGQWPYPKFQDLWYYDPDSDKWTERESIQINIENIYQLKGANTAYGYCFYDNRLFEYNTTFDTWEEMNKLQLVDRLCYPYFFSWQNKLFVIDVKNYNSVKYFAMWSHEK